MFHLICNDNEIVSVQTSIELDPVDWLAFRRGVVTPENHFKLENLMNLAGNFVEQSNKLMRFENNALNEGFDRATASQQTPIFTRVTRRCTDANCAGYRDGSEKK